MCGHLPATDVTRVRTGDDWPLADASVAPPVASSRMTRPLLVSEGGPIVSTTQASDRFTALPDDQALAATVVALEEHGFGVEVVNDLDAARESVVARIPEGSSVMTNTSVTLEETGITEAINNGGPYDSARNKL